MLSCLSCSAIVKRSCLASLLLVPLITMACQLNSLPQANLQSDCIPTCFQEIVSMASISQKSLGSHSYIELGEISHNLFLLKGSAYRLDNTNLILTLLWTQMSALTTIFLLLFLTSKFECDFFTAIFQSENIKQLS